MLFHISRFKYIFLFASFLLISCGKQNINTSVNQCKNISTPCLVGKVSVLMQTNIGDVTIELDGDSAPINSGSFLDLINKGIYNGTVFHRVINKPMPFIVQGGDPYSKNTTQLTSKFGTGNYIDLTSGQVRLLPLELKLINENSPRYSQLIYRHEDLSRLQLRHKRGSIAMARSQFLDSASSQFYIALRPLPELDGRYTVFGRVINGMDIIDKIEQGDRIIKITLGND